MSKRTLLAQTLRDCADAKHAFFFVGYATEDHHGDFHIFTKNPNVSEAEAINAAVAIAVNFLKAHRPEVLTHDR